MQATHDLCLMGLLAARERTKEDWTKLLDTAGFQVIKIWEDTRGVENVIEAELKEGLDDVEDVVSAASIESEEVEE